MKKENESTATKIRKNITREVNILPLMLYLLKKLWIILLAGIVAGGLGYAAVKMFMHPTYRCSFTAYVNNKTSAVSTDFLNSSDVSAAKQLVQTYSHIFNSNTILASADEAMNVHYDVMQLKSMVGTQIVDETELIQVYVIAKSDSLAYEIASAIARVSPAIMSDIVEGSSMKIVEYPQPPDHIYQPNYRKYTLLFFGIGCALAIAVLLILYWRNDTVSDEKDLESRFSVPVLGVIPDVNAVTSGKSGYYYNYYYEQKDGEQKETKQT